LSVKARTRARSSETRCKEGLTGGMPVFTHSVTSQDQRNPRGLASTHPPRALWHSRRVAYRRLAKMRDSPEGSEAIGEWLAAALHVVSNATEREA
jgi:hypothetical protein